MGDLQMDLSESDYYIAVTKTGQVGFITQVKYANGEYTLRSFTKLTKADGWSSFNSSSLESLIKRLLASELKFKIYQFDCPIKALEFATTKVKEELGK